MRKHFVRLAVVLALVAAFFFARATWFAAKPIPVNVGTVSRGLVESTVTNTRAGTVKARRRAKLSPQTGGRVVELPKRKGDLVAAGDLLVRLDPELSTRQLDLAARDLTTALAEQNRACLTADHAVRERDRQKRLADDGILSTDLYDAASTAAETSAAGCTAAKAVVERARSAVALARSVLDQTELRAPFAGIVADLMVELGEWATPAPPAVPVPPVVDLIDPASIYISAPMDEVDSGRIQPGQRVKVTVDSRPGETYPGRVTRVAPYVEDIEAQNRTVEIEVEIDDATLAATLLPGTSSDVEVILETREDVARVPTTALLEGSRVYLVGPEERLVERTLEPGLRNWDWTEIRAGLEAGDRFVTSLDRAGLEPGALVTVLAGAPDAGGKDPRAASGASGSRP
jgi:HlyD family secretion protein